MVIQPKLSQLRDCFQGIIPALFCTQDERQEPNISFLSQVEYINESQLALSNQFFSKTKQNIVKTKYGLLYVLHPASLQAFEIRVRYIKSETSGEIFEKLQLRLQIIAASEGMAHIFELRSADIYEIVDITCRNSLTRKPVFLPPPLDERIGIGHIELSRSFLETVSAKHTPFHEAAVLFLRSLRYGFGFPNTKLYWANEDSVQDIETQSTSEAERELSSDQLAMILKVVQFGKPLILSGLQLQRKYANSILPEKVSAPSTISRRIALPIMAESRVFAVLLIDDEKNEAWDLDLLSSIKMMANTLGLLLMQNREAIPQLECTSEKELKFRFHTASETLFFDDLALFKSLPAKIFAFILNKSLSNEATSNQEIICSLANEFPKEGKPNLEARLSLIKRRIQERAIPLKIVSIERGRFHLLLDKGFQISFTRE